MTGLLSGSDYTTSRASPHPDGHGSVGVTFGGSGSDGMKTLVETVSIGCMNRITRLVGLLAARPTGAHYDPNA